MATQKWKEDNKEKMRKYRKDWYERNKDTEQKRIMERQEELRKWFYELKATFKCSRCPESHPACIDFHHRDPFQKEAILSQVWKKKGWSKERILKEIEKCDALCANCHRKLHYKEREFE